MATYVTAKTKPRAPNAAGRATARIMLPNMVQTTVNWITGRRGS
jgi:hypothetical protein